MKKNRHSEASAFYPPTESPMNKTLDSLSLFLIHTLYRSNSLTSRTRYAVRKDHLPNSYNASDRQIERNQSGHQKTQPVSGYKALTQKAQHVENDCEHENSEHRHELKEEVEGMTVWVATPFLHRAPAPTPTANISISDSALIHLCP